MWYAEYKTCYCILNSITKRDLPEYCPSHNKPVKTIWTTHTRSTKEKRRSHYQLRKKEIAKHRRTSGYREYQAEYHPNWVELNREKWNKYQRKWRAKKRGHPVKPRFAPGKLKALAEKYGVHPCTISKWIKKGELIIKKDYP